MDKDSSRLWSSGSSCSSVGSCSASFSGNSSAVQSGRRRDGRTLILSGKRIRECDVVSKHEFLRTQKEQIGGVTLLRWRLQSDVLERLRKYIGAATRTGNVLGHPSSAIISTFVHPETICQRFSHLADVLESNHPIRLPRSQN